MPTDTRSEINVPGIPPRDEWDYDFYDRERKVELNEDFSGVVVVDCLPIVSSEKYERLNTAIRKLFKEHGEFKSDIYHPYDDEKGMTYGCAYIEYTSRSDANEAVNGKNGTKFSRKSAKMRVNLFSDFEKFEDYSDEYKEPSLEDVEQKGNLQHYLLDDTFRDQFVIRQGDLTEIFWNDPVMTHEQGRNIVYAGERETMLGRTWTDGYAMWSPRGSYLATFHKQGIATWGGPDFQKLHRFAHPDVCIIDFSPMENYLVTFVPREEDRSCTYQCLTIHDVKTGGISRAFQGGASLTKFAGRWPVFKWSFDDKYFARLEEDSICIYETPSMKLLDKKRLKVPRVDNFEWSPTDHIISYTVPEAGNQPASIILVSIPDRKAVGQKHLTMVSKMSLHWQEKGDYLSVKVEKHSKTKKHKGTSFFTFRVRNKDVPVDTLDIVGEIIERPPRIPLRQMRGQPPPPQEPPPVKIVAFAWEPVGNRFAMIHQEQTGGKHTVSIYKITPKKIKRMTELKSRIANRLYWSPVGGHLIIAGLGDMNGELLEFYDATKKGVVARSTNHRMCTDIEWDPAGRYVCSFVAQPIVPDMTYKSTMENGYRIWSNCGELKAEVRYEAMYVFQWRPRPPTLLSEARIKKIRQELKSKYTSKFQQQDQEAAEGAMDFEAKMKLAKLKEFKSYRVHAKREYAHARAQREELRDGRLSDDEREYHVEEVEMEQLIGEPQIEIEED